MTMPVDPAFTEGAGENGFTPPATPAVEQPATPAPSQPSGRFTEDDLAKARQQEKDKLYPQLQTLKEQLDTLSRERDQRLAEEQAARQAAEEEARRKAEEEMSLRDLLDQRTREMQERLDSLQREREQEQAVIEQERRYNALANYRAQRIEQERDNILPDLIDLVDGDSEDEIDSSIARLIDRSSRILESTAEVFSARQPSPGTRVTAPAAGPLDANTGQRTFSAEEISRMSATEYAQHRQSLLRGATTSRGLFG